MPSRRATWLAATHTWPPEKEAAPPTLSALSNSVTGTPRTAAPSAQAMPDRPAPTTMRCCVRSDKAIHSVLRPHDPVLAGDEVRGGARVDPGVVDERLPLGRAQRPVRDQ